MGLQIKHFIASCNENDVLPRYLETGIFEPADTKHTLSNAMDVGNPSNFTRIETLYGYMADFLRSDLKSWKYSDDETRGAIRQVYKKYNYILDPHGAVGFCGSEQYHQSIDPDKTIITVETAHPAKFPDCVEKELNIKVQIPERLAAYCKKKKQAVKMSSEYEYFKSWLLKR